MIDIVSFKQLQSLKEDIVIIDQLVTDMIMNLINEFRYCEVATIVCLTLPVHRPNVRTAPEYDCQSASVHPSRHQGCIRQ